jgi:glc operon protein GlcG
MSLSDWRKFMLLRSIASRLAKTAILLCVITAYPQQMPNPYGLPISLDNAKKAVEVAIAEARKNNWTMAIAVVDPNGTLVYYEKMDNTQNGSADVSISKARSASLFKRPTRAFEDLIAQGGDGLRYLRMEGAIPIEGGIPIVIGGKIVGAIGVSGGKSAQDVQCAQLGVDALK